MRIQCGCNEQQYDVWVWKRCNTLYTPFYWNSWCRKTMMGFWRYHILNRTPRATRGNKQQGPISGQADTQSDLAGHIVAAPLPTTTEHSTSTSATQGRGASHASVPCLHWFSAYPRYSTPFQPGFFWTSSCTRRFFSWGRPVTQSGACINNWSHAAPGCSSHSTVDGNFWPSAFDPWRQRPGHLCNYMASFSGRSRKCSGPSAGVEAPSKHGHSWPWTSIFSNSISTSSGRCSKMSARVTASTSMFLGSLPTPSPLKTLLCPAWVHRRLLHSCKGWR